MTGRRAGLLSLRGAGSLLAVTALLAGSPSCEAIVGDSLPSTLHCSGDVGALCPTGQACIHGTCGVPTGCVGPDCIRLPDAGRDAGHDARHPGWMDAPQETDTGHDVGKTPVDTGADVPAVLGVLGDACDPALCAMGLACVDGTDLFGLGLSGSICSMACCTNADCGSDNICYPTAGGNLCITASVAMACGKMCGTSCCTDTDCSKTGDICALGSTSAGVSVPECQSKGVCTGGFEGDTCEAGGKACELDSDCDSGACYDLIGDGCYGDTCECLATCCGQSDCSGGGGACQWLSTEDPLGAALLLRTCVMPNGTTASGLKCSSGTTPTDCLGGICGVFSGTSLCTQPCCTTSDCMGIGSGGWTCAPYSDEVGPDTTSEVLACQPPKNPAS